MSLLPERTARQIPMSAYEQAGRIPEENRCEACRGLGWVCEKHGLLYNTYGVCFSCRGDGLEMTTPPTPMTPNYLALLDSWQQAIARPFLDEIIHNAQIAYERQETPFRWEELSLLAKQSYCWSAAMRFFNAK